MNLKIKIDIQTFFYKKKKQEISAHSPLFYLQAVKTSPPNTWAVILCAHWKKISGNLQIHPGSQDVDKFISVPNVYQP